MNKLKVDDIHTAYDLVKNVIRKTPLERNDILSDKYECNVYLKREDLQMVRSFKIRGAYNHIVQLTEEEVKNGVVCASAGNHAQGVAYTCHALGIHAKIFMPNTTPNQKVSQVKFFGGEWVEVILIGDTFDHSFHEAMQYCQQNKMAFIHPFDDKRVIAGQGTIGIEIVEQMEDTVDFLFAGIGGGGLVSGVGTYFKDVSPTTKIVGVEPSGAASMQASLKSGHIVIMDPIDKFVDGAAVQQVGQQTFELCQEVIDDIVLVPEGKVCTTILQLYNENAIVAEPAGALTIGALDFYQEQIKGKNVVCIISGGNNDVDRMQEIKERSLIYESLKHYFIINFPQRAGALREFLDRVLGPNDDITRFEYTKKTSKDNGPALVGVELQNRNDYGALLDRMNTNGIQYVEINSDPALFNLLV